jgi:Glutamine amidotransferases class-II
LCELLGMDANVPTDICFSFAGLMQRGGATGPHRDGWGIALYARKGCHTFHDPKPSDIRTTVISPGAVATELPSHITDPQSAAGIQQFYEGFAIPAESFARAVGFAIEQPGVDINEILFRPMRREL